MIDPRLLRDEPERVRAALSARHDSFALDPFLALEAETRRLRATVEQKQAERNRASGEIGRLARVPERRTDFERAKAAAKALGEELAGLERDLAEFDARVAAERLCIPNVPHASVPVGADAGDNVEVARWGEPRPLGFEPKPHWDLGERLGILDPGRAAKVAGTRFTVLRGEGAMLERALLSFMLDLHVREHGYVEILPPFLVNADALTGTGQLPKFAEDLFAVDGGRYYLNPTAEVPVTNLHRDEILAADELPVRYAAWTACFRAEAGSYGADTRGLIRQHQFLKVELVQLTHPDRSAAALEELTGHARTVLERLELPYRVVSLCTGDLGFSASKTYDLEVWLPGQGAYREISSCSSFEDFQARRAGIRFREVGEKPRLVHTLNGSGLAVGRTTVAILENYQQEDGSVCVPEALRPYLGGRDVIGRPA